tara:strand:+ start:89 stop:1420 length:1332 start_codon:yes stop_codon:yes gene_type:complete
MSENKTPYKIPYKFMNDFVRRKYALNIKQAINKVTISPKNYTLKSSVNKTWFVYFWYYRIGETKKRKFEISTIELNDQLTQINRIKDHALKVELIEKCKEATIDLLNQDVRFILKLLYGNTKAQELYPSLYLIEQPKEDVFISIDSAFNEVYNNKVNVSNAYKNDLKSVKNRFLNFLGDNKNDDVKLLNKKLIVSFLNDVTAKTSNRTYNNIKTNLKTFLEGLKDLDYIERNYLDGVKNKQTKARRNRALTRDELDKLFKETKKTNIVLYYFMLHIYYCLMRPATIVRIKVKDVDLENNRFLTDTKTGTFLKLIPDRIKKEFYNDFDLGKNKPNDYIFFRNDLFGSWSAKDENRREYYTNAFKPIKDKIFNDNSVTLYSLRHTGIGHIFEAKSKELKEKGTPDYKNEAVRFIMPITNHKTLEQAKEYLRGISMELHEDWSKYL